MKLIAPNGVHFFVDYGYVKRCKLVWGTAAEIDSKFVKLLHENLLIQF